MCSTITMDQQQFIQSSPEGTQSSAGSANELPPDISHMDFQTIKAASDTLKKNSKLQFGQGELLRLLSYLEGELQARDVVIAALKSEKLKNIINISRHKPLSLNDPQAALFRDALACTGSYVTRQSSTAAAQSENEIRQFAGHQLDILEETIRHQRSTHYKLLTMMRDTENKQNGLMRELEEEKRKHERDTAQGDDITYGLEIERTRLRQELEVEKVARRKCEKDLKKSQEQLEQERARQKQIVLLLLAERKKIITKYIEERKRSEDLAQILSEEKQRVDTIAEGLEEESKKSLQMEAELEKQMQAFTAEKKLLNGTLAKEEKRIKEQEFEIAQLKAENDMIRKQALPHRLGPKNVPIPQVPAKIGGLRNNSNTSIDTIYSQDDKQVAAGIGSNTTTTSSPMISSVAKVVQPTATVSSVPVSGPTTGIARSIPAGQSLRQQPQYQSTINSPNSSNTSDAGHSHVFNKGSNVPLASSGVALPVQSAIIDQQSSPPPPSTSTLLSNTSTIAKKKQIIPATVAGTPPLSAQTGTNNNGGRGVPPPIPPNKPIIPPKRESSATRLLATGAATAATAMINNSNSALTTTGSNAVTNANAITTASGTTANVKLTTTTNQSGKSTPNKDGTAIPSLSANNLSIDNSQ